MTWKRKKRITSNPEIDKARKDRDKLLEDVKDATDEVDSLVDDLLMEQYKEANGVSE